jgi:hypothetical protein
MSNQKNGASGIITNGPSCAMTSASAATILLSSKPPHQPHPHTQIPITHHLLRDPTQSSPPKTTLNRASAMSTGAAAATAANQNKSFINKK